jgi:Holliday junction resolvase-like predicted endonuclease
VNWTKPYFPQSLIDIGYQLSVERNLVISLLKLTNSGSVTLEALNKDARIPAISAKRPLELIQNQGSIKIEGGKVEIESNGRIQLAIKAVQLGFDLKTVSSFLRWQEFEKMAVYALNMNGYTTIKNLHFRHNSKRWELDAIGYKSPNIICVDCKQYHLGLYPTALKKMVTSQIKRVEAFAQALSISQIERYCPKWPQAKFIPAILSLTEGSPKIFDGVPIVPVMQLQDFISQLPAYVQSLKYFARDFPKV